MFPLPPFYRITTVACGKSSISLACGDRIVRPARSTKRSNKQKEKKWNKERKEKKQNEWAEGPLCPRFFLPTPPIFAPLWFSRRSYQLMGQVIYITISLTKVTNNLHIYCLMLVFSFYIYKIVIKVYEVKIFFYFSRAKAWVFYKKRNPLKKSTWIKSNEFNFEWR